MEINENTIDLFEKYLNGALKLNEVSHLEKKIELDKAFSEIFTQFKAAKKAVALLGRERLKNNLSSVMEKAEKKSLKVSKKSGVNEALSEIFYKFFAPYENILTSRSGPAKENELFKAMSLYSKGDYISASFVFKKLIKKDSKNLLIYFYYGISELYQDNFETSKKLFKKVISNEKDFLNDLSRWYLGLNYLKSGDLNSAKKKFGELSNTGKSQDSKKILKEINSL